MNDRELIVQHLAGQHLTVPADALTAAGDLCGIQSQFYPTGFTHRILESRISAGIPARIKVCETIERIAIAGVVVQ